MTRIHRLMKLHRLMNSAGDTGSDTSGTDTGEQAATTAAALALAVAEAAALTTAEAARKLSEGKPALTDAEAKLLKDAMKQKARALELEGELSKANDKLKSFEGIDVEAARKVLADQEAAERQRLIAAGDFDRLTKQMAERHAAEKTMFEQRAEESGKTSATLQQQIADLTVGNAFATSKFVGEDLTLTPNKARVIYGAHFEFKEGSIVGYDKPAGASDRTVLVDASGTPLSFEGALRKVIDADPDKDHLLRSKVKSGSGSTTTKGAKQVEQQQRGQLSNVEKIAAGLKALAIKA